MKKPIPLYSLVIFPTTEQSTLVKSWKQQLQNQINWFGSANAAAHITILQSENEMLMSLYIDQIREYCKSATAQNVTLNTFGDFYPHTFFIAPDEPSKEYLDKLIIDLHDFLGFKINRDSIKAHLTIARKLNSEKLKTAYDLFINTKVNLQFSCDAFYLRKFNYHTNQYSDIVEKIDIGYK